MLDSSESWYKYLQELTDKIRTIASSEDYILPEHLRSVKGPLTDEQKEEVRKVLMPYAEMQMEIRKAYTASSELTFEDLKRHPTFENA